MRTKIEKNIIKYIKKELERENKEDWKDILDNILSIPLPESELNNIYFKVPNDDLIQEIKDFPVIDYTEPSNFFDELTATIMGNVVVELQEKDLEEIESFLESESN